MQSNGNTGAKAEAPEVLFVPEIARMMRMSPVTVYDAIHSGDLPAERYGTGKNSIRVRREDFERWREAHRIKPAAH